VDVLQNDWKRVWGLVRRYQSLVYKIRQKFFDIGTNLDYPKKT